MRVVTQTAVTLRQECAPKILQPGHNTWRVACAARAAVLTDAGQYFRALRESLRTARSSVFILGWDIDSRMRLVGEDGRTGDELPEELGPFLKALVERRPDLVINILVWDYSILYAPERQLFPAASFQWQTPSRVRFCLDDNLPLGASHHQKIVVIDDAVAFCGGLDLTSRRWDTRDHDADDPRRVDVGGKPYPPFHDVQAVVDGPAAAALGQLARARWARGACEKPPASRRLSGELWPQSVIPDFTNIEVGVARTYASTEPSTREVREVERLFIDSIGCAQQTIYIENQYLTSQPIVRALVERLQAVPTLEAVLVVPPGTHSWLERQTVHAGLVRSLEQLSREAVGERVGVFYPAVHANGRTLETLVHSKVMIVDDVLLRVGSANLNNRSLGLDTECDLAFAARTRAHREAIITVRNRLLGHHCGAGAAAVAKSLGKTGSLVRTARALCHNGHSLKAIDRAALGAVAHSPLQAIGDPEQPIAAPAFLEALVGPRPNTRRLGSVLGVMAVGIALIAIALIWRFLPISQTLEGEGIARMLAAYAELPGSIFVVVAIFVLGGLVMFPVLLMIAATAATFGPWLGPTYAGAGALASAAVSYGIGALLGRRTLDEVLGPRLNRIRRVIARRGVLAIAAIRMVPVAPFTLVNLVAGASRIRFSDFMLGTVLGMAPGIVLMSLLGSRLASLLTEPTPSNIALLIAAVLGWIGLTLTVQALLRRARGGSR
ncbi:MAG: VTT domain-containing protein [Xanthobacteraceae bacterium]